MSVNLQFNVEDVDVQIVTYESIRVYRSTSQYGSYSQVTDITLVASTYQYTYTDSGGDLNSWYKYSYFHATGPVESDLSAQFRPDGTTLQRVRQRAMEEYGAGIIFVASAGGGATVTSTDFRLLASSLLSTNRGKGTWLYRPGEDNPANTRMITTYAPTTGIFTVGANWTNAPSSGEVMEWHWLVDPIIWNNAVERACERYWFTERIPIKGVADQDEYALATYMPWLHNRDHFHDLRWYPNRTSAGVDDGLDEPFGIEGKWWKVREDRGVLTLQIHPEITTSDLLYAVTSRQLAPLYAEAAAPPIGTSEAYLAALAYDEVLAYLVKPGVGNAQDRANWNNARLEHNRVRLRRLARENKVKLPTRPPLLSSPPVVPAPYGSGR